MKTIVSRQELQAALLFASVDESRYVLNGVNIECRKDKQPILISTDGRRLCVIESEADQNGQNDGDAQILLATSFLKPICALNKAIGGKLFPLIQIETSPGSKQVVVTFKGDTFFVEAHDGALIEGNYPRWREAVPNGEEREQVRDLPVNSGYLADFHKAAALLARGGDLGIRINLVHGEGKGMEVLLTGAPRFFGVVMPMNVEDRPNFQPEFLCLEK